MEEWRDVLGYEGLYQVSNYGNVRSLNWRRRGVVRNLYLKKHPAGYRQVELFAFGTKRMVTVHRLVAEAFIPNVNGLPLINHIDENKTNNSVFNLEWCTHAENRAHSINLHPERYMRKSTKRTRRNSSYTRYTGRAILQLEIGGEFVRKWEDASAIKKRLGYNTWSITQCCNGDRKTAYGFEWCFAI